MRRSLLLTGLGFLLLVEQGAAQRPSFDVVSIKPNLSGLANGGMGPRAEGFSAKNVTLMTLLVYAYKPADRLLLKSQVIGGPGWINTDHFDIEAKREGTAQVTPDEARTMLHALLEDRFQLKQHLETRELPVYNLVRTKGNLPLSKDQSPPPAQQGFIAFGPPGDPAALPRGAMRMNTTPSGTILTGASISISRLMTLLQGVSELIIYDKTGFGGLIDIHLEFSESLAVANSSAPSVFSALPDIGLKLEPAKELLDVVVIDAVQRPSEN